MRNQLILLLTLCLLAGLCAPGRTEAQTTLTAQSAMKFLSIGVGARPAGMGDSFISNGNDVATIFWNPAGLATLSGTRGFVDVNNWISDIRQYSLALSQDMGNWGVMGLSFTMMDYGQIHGTAIDLVTASSGSFEYIETGDVKVANYAVGLTYARAVSEQFSVGAQVKFVYSGLGSNTISYGRTTETMDNTLSTLAFDMGTRFNTGFRNLTFSMSLRNFSREVRYPHMTQGYYLPLVFTLGFSVDALLFVMEEGTPHSLVLSANGLHPMDNAERANLGAEYAYAGQYFLRGGYKINYNIESLALGAGVRFPFGEEGEFIQLDYAYSAMKYFSGVHRLSLSTEL